MKTVMTVLALTLACSGCKTVAPLLTNSIKNMSPSQMQSMVGTVGKVVEAQKEVTQQEEIVLGQLVGSNLLGAGGLWDDKKAQRYVSKVGKWLATNSDRPDLEWHFAVLADDSLNAFAAPGGYIFITRGLLLSMKSEAELAGVLGHEIAHVTRKHHLAAIRSDKNSALFKDILSTVANQTLLQSKYAAISPLATPAIAGLANGLTKLYLRGLDKEDEYEADKIGVALATRSGYDPFGLPAVLQQMQSVRPDAKQMELLFKTHPSFSSRLERLAGVMGSEFDRFEAQPALESRFKREILAAKPDGKSVK